MSTQPLYDTAMTFISRQGSGVFTSARFQRALRVGFVKAGSLLADLQDAGEIRWIKPGLYEITGKKED